MRAVANCVSSHSARFGDQMPTRSPRRTPSAHRPAADASTSSSSCCQVKRNRWSTNTAASRSGQRRAAAASSACTVESLSGTSVAPRTCDRPPCGTRGSMCSVMLVSRSLHTRRAAVPIENPVLVDGTSMLHEGFFHFQPTVASDSPTAWRAAHSQREPISQREHSASPRRRPNCGTLRGRLQPTKRGRDVQHPCDSRVSVGRRRLTRQVAERQARQR